MPDNRNLKRKWQRLNKRLDAARKEVDRLGKLHNLAAGRHQDLMEKWLELYPSVEGIYDK